MKIICFISLSLCAILLMTACQDNDFSLQNRAGKQVAVALPVSESIISSNKELIAFMLKGMENAEKSPNKKKNFDALAGFVKAVEKENQGAIVLLEEAIGANTNIDIKALERDVLRFISETVRLVGELEKQGVVRPEEMQPIKKMASFLDELVQELVGKPLVYKQKEIILHLYMHQQSLFMEAIHIAIKYITPTVLVYDEFDIVAQPLQAQALVGEDYSIEIGLGTYSSQATYSVSVDGRPFAVSAHNNKAVLKIRPSREGINEYEVVVNLNNPMTGEVNLVKRKLSYYALAR